LFPLAVAVAAKAETVEPVAQDCPVGPAVAAVLDRQEVQPVQELLGKEITEALEPMQVEEQAAVAQAQLA
jgi:hypothetical protein